MDNGKGWGGKRNGAGRKRQSSRLVADKTKVMRLPERHWVRIKNGAYDEIIHILREQRETMEESKEFRNSPRWSKLWELMDEIDVVLGSDWQSWEG